MNLIYKTQPDISGLDIENYTTWENQSLPLGNGYFGISIFGFSNEERIQITENSFCNPYASDSNYPKYCSGLQSFCDIFIKFGHKTVKNYRKKLSLNDSLLTINYDFNNNTYKREMFASRPNKVFVTKLTSKNKNGLSFEVSIKIPFLGTYRPNNQKTFNKTGNVHIEHNCIIAESVLDFYNVKCLGILKIDQKNGILQNEGDKIVVKNADYAILTFTCLTNYEINENVFLEENPKKKLKEKDLLFEAKNIIYSLPDYNTLKQNHIKDYQKLYNRVYLSLGKETTNLSVPELIKNYKNGNKNKYLEVLLFQYGRYLLISSSRQGSLPANLQGIWSAYKSSPWSSGYWHNINVQMNYWLTGPCNLTELFLSYSDYALAYLKAARKNADEYIKTLYPENYEENNNGFIVGTGGWPYLIGGLEPNSHSGPGTGGFTSLLFYEYFMFTQDKKYLKNVAYPILKEMSIFLLKTLEKNGDEYLVKYSASPENIKNENSEWNDYFYCKGCAFDQQMVYENFDKTIISSKILGIKNDPFIKKIEKILPHLSPVIIGKSGQVKEYREEEYYGDIGEKQHRHISQLVGLYPGTLINQNNKKWLNAAKYSLNQRGDKSTGWATMHRLCAWARIKDGEHCYKIINNFISNNVLENLWDSHPPFQIDGNFGYSAAIAEMLIQSHEGYIDILPSIPKEWKNIEFKGLLARGNYEINLSYKNNLTKIITIKSNSGGILKIKNKKYTVWLNDIHIETNKEIIEINTKKDDLITIKGIQ